MYLVVRDLFSMKVDVVFYDITSIYFERREPKGNLMRHGNNKRWQAKECADSLWFSDGKWVSDDIIQELLK